MCIRDSGKIDQADWQKKFDAYQKEFPELAQEFMQATNSELPNGWNADLPVFTADKPLATRASSGQVLNAIAKKIPTLIGGSADLNPSTDTALKLSLIHISEPTRLGMISYAVFCLK